MHYCDQIFFNNTYLPTALALKILTLIFFILFSQILSGQILPEVREEIERMEKELEEAQHDSTKINALFGISDYLEAYNVDTLPIFTDKILSLCHQNLKKENLSQKEEHFFKTSMLWAEFRDGWYLRETGNVLGALVIFQSLIEKAKEFGNLEIEGTANMFVGFLRSSLGQDELAINNQLRSLEIFKQENNAINIGRAHNNLASTYERLGEDSLAFYHGKTAFEIIYKEDSTSFIFLYVIDFLLEYHLDHGNLDSAKVYLGFAKRLIEHSYDNHGKISLYNLLSRIELQKGNYNKAYEYSLASKKYADVSGNPHFISQSARANALALEKLGRFEEAISEWKIHKIMDDSIRKGKTQMASMGFEFEKEKLILEQKQKEKEEKLKARNQFQFFILVAGSLVLTLVILFTWLLVNRLKLTKRQKKIIESTNEELNQYNEEISAQRDNIEIQRVELERRNKLITESIQYAKRIQNAILPPIKVFEANLPESFIFYKPKDIVAGDFYWFEKLDNQLLFAVADCTGHGVPGAMVSVVCNNGLNRSVREHKLEDPGEILNKTREIVVKEFEKSDEEVQDGMDIALCAIKGSVLNYAGAHNPLWLFRGMEMTEVKADKQPIGKYDSPRPYNTRSIELEKGDTIYLFSDGLVDQFGGPKGKKYLASRFKALLASLQNEPMKNQGIQIEKVFEEWRGSEEQIDDICIMGIRF